ncbi:M23 family metallopeptidase [Ruegeria lacuscaerulensis]|uniref:M23 family metallopeptidase n=1 Tax=Ruegeria lacuscaerulensis TaxID=55218 RepID=UPI00147A612D|nr:M23 family metallopeptidase [Ruegeria lacuscaerulensis]
MAVKKPREVVLPDAVRAERLFPNNFGPYPAQTRLPVEAGKAGELRGFYRTAIEDNTGKTIISEYWRPRSSAFGGRSGGGHDGLDIFAPPNRFPYETPVVALGAGKLLQLRADALHPNNIGNMAVLRLDGTYDGYQVQFLYGHLSRFHGPDVERHKGAEYKARRVRKGEVIGYAGCTGNANDLGECNPDNGEWRVSSGHVHLVAQLIRKAPSTVKGQPEETVTPVDPVKLLGWSLKFEGDDKSRSLAYWKANLRPDAAYAPAMRGGKIDSKYKRTRRRKNGLRNPLPKPYETLEFDHSRSIRRTLDAYRELLPRLGNIDKTGRAREAYRNSHAAIETQIDKVFDPAVAELEAARKGKVFGGPLLRALVSSQFCLWHLMGGAAFFELASNRNRFDLARITRLVECGPGVLGRASIIGMPGAQSSLYRARLKLPNADGSTRKREISSISFGAGSLTHATLSQDAELALVTSVPKASGFLGGVFVATAEIGRLHVYAVRQAKRLSRDRIKVADPERKRVIARLKRVRNAVLSTSIPLEPGAGARVLNDTELDALMTAVLEANVSVFEETLRLSNLPEGRKPIAPRLDALRIMEGAAS